MANPVADLTLYRIDSPAADVSYLQKPSICLILQGEKSVRLGEHQYRYGNGQFACYSVDLSLIADVASGSADCPNLGIKLNLNCELLLNVMQEMGVVREDTRDSGALTVGTPSDALIGAYIRLLDLLENPNEIPILAPLIQKEIYYRLLTSEQGARIRQIIRLGGHLMQISHAIGYLKTHFADTVSVQQLADICGMSLSGFYHHFRHLTGISPLQYQKQLRLTEAQRLIKTKSLNLTLAAIAYQVGYESASQFSREYKRYFGRPPSEG